MRTGGGGGRGRSDSPGLYRLAAATPGKRPKGMSRPSIGCPFGLYFPRPSLQVRAQSASRSTPLVPRVTVTCTLDLTPSVERSGGTTIREDDGVSLDFAQDAGDDRGSAHAHPAYRGRADLS